MDQVSAEQLEQWVAEARQRWNAPGIAWRGDRLDFPRDGFVNMVTLATRVP